VVRTRIEPSDIFDRAGLCDALGIGERCISREISLGRLRASRRSRRTFFLGNDVLDWIQAGEATPEALTDDEDVETDERLAPKKRRNPAAS
jgi:hypothetical protein